MSRLYTLFALPFVAALAAAQTPCDQLKLTFPDVKIMSIQFVAAGPFAAPTGTLTPVLPGPVAPAAAKGAPAGRGGRGPAGPAASVPAYCRVLMVMTPSSDSLIDTAVFLPTENWNGKLQVVGNGGWAGSVSYPAMAPALREGYAVASNDTGHRANDEEWLGSTRNLARQRRVGQLVRPVLFTRVESQEWTPLKRDVIANRSAEHRITSLERVENRPLRDWPDDLERHLIVHARERAEMHRQDHADHNVCTSTESTAGRSRTIGAHVSPPSDEP